MKNWEAKFAWTVTTLFMLALVGFVLLWPVGCSHPIAEPTDFTVTLYWTAPGDNGHTGTASEYDLRYSLQTITEANWASSPRIDIPVPQIAGTTEQVTVTIKAESEVEVFWGIKTSDGNGWSNISNVISNISDDTELSAMIIDLRFVE